MQTVQGRAKVFFAFSAPTIIWLLLFFVVPLGIIWLYSFGENVSITLIATASHKAKPWLLLLIMLPFWTNLLIRTYALLNILGTRGRLNDVLRWLYERAEQSLNFLPIYSALERMDKTLLEASMDLGAGQWSTARNILIPMAMPGIVTAAIITFIPALGQFLIPDLLGRGQVDMIANVIERQFKKANDWPFGSAISLTLLYATFMLLAIRSFNDSARSKREGRRL